MKRRYGLAGLAVASLVLVASAAAETKLAGTVGPGFTITLRTTDGADVTKLDPGEVEIEVKDLSEEHNFHLSGPGVNLTTGVEAIGDTTFRATLADGRYRVDASLSIHELNELLDAQLPRDRWNTVGGLMFGLAGTIPQPGQTVTFEGFRFTAEKVQGRRVTSVLVTRMPSSVG